MRIILSIVGQCVAHMIALVYSVDTVCLFLFLFLFFVFLFLYFYFIYFIYLFPPFSFQAHQIYLKANGERVVDVEGDFEPDMVNTAVFLIMCSTQFITFFVNYQVPFLFFSFLFFFSFSPSSLFPSSLPLSPPSSLIPASFLQGQPFMESLQENKALFYGLWAACVSVVLLVLAPFPDLNYLLELSPIPFWFRLRLLAVIMGDFVVCWGWEWLIVLLFGN